MGALADTMSAQNVTSTGAPLQWSHNVHDGHTHIHIHINDDTRDCRYGEYCSSRKQCVRQLRDANRLKVHISLCV